MGGSLARGIAAGSFVAAGDVTVADPSEQSLAKVRSWNDKIGTTADNGRAVKGADLVIMAVKPWQLEEVLAGLKPALDYGRQAVGSIVAGVSFEELSRMLDKGDGTKPALYRIIPNTAASIGESVTFIASEGADAGQQDQLLRIFGELGTVMAIDESMVPAATSLASCGIAFALQYMNASMQGGVDLGFTREQSREIVMQTVRGALGLMAHNGTMPQAEIDKVTTPGGLTLKGLKAMQEAGFEEAVIAGLKESR